MPLLSGKRLITKVDYAVCLYGWYEHLNPVEHLWKGWRWKIIGDSVTLGGLQRVVGETYADYPYSQYAI